MKNSEQIEKFEKEFVDVDDDEEIDIGKNEVKPKNDEKV